MNKPVYYPNTSNNPDLPEYETSTLAQWQEHGIFRQSVEHRPSVSEADGSNNEYVFYDGPPFANGLPHYGHLLTSYVKDVFARYHTMKGERVERRFGWDCHGLPAEMEAEKELKVSGRAAIEAFGIEKFNTHCQTSVMKYTDQWRDYINRAARWVDFDNDYKTMDKSYMESVIWAFKQLYDKGLVYESHRVMPYSWAAQTPLSNFETRMDDAYREREDKAITVAFRLQHAPKGAPEADTYYVLAWTTTPWTLPSNLALAADEAMEYVCVTQQLHAENSRVCYILAKSALSRYGNELSANEENITTLKGADIIGLSYEPLFPYFAKKKDEWNNAFTILAGDFIEEGSGTGVVHLAPGFGEDDQRVCGEAGIGILCPVDEAGCYSDAIFDIGSNDSSPLAGDLPPLTLKGLNVIAQTDGQCEAEPYKPEQLQKYGLVNLRIIQWLKMTGKLVKQENYSHSYPHCWRTDTPLIYKAVPSWYVEVTKFKDRMVELNQNINWIPDHIRDGQFGKWLENARDWSISRNRYWGCPIPVWRTESGKIKVFGSIAELEEFFGVEVSDLHKPFIDSLTKEENGESWTRVSDVFDCWFESGSMPFAQVHYPFENKEWFESHFPADFIVEYIGQTRGWFYTLMVLGTALFDKEPFRNCICHGIILDAEGKKLSKRLRNYPDPNEMFNQYGADAMRWRMISEPVMQGGNLLISKDGEDIRDVVRLTLKPIWNAYHFFTLYANTDGIHARECISSDNIMDRYILAKLKHAVLKIAESLDSYDTPSACKEVEGFFDVMNNWYIRRSRDRFWREMGAEDKDKYAAYNTLYTCLITMCRAASPLLPLLTEAIHSGLVSGGAEFSPEHSVHLADFPDVSAIEDERQLMADMDRLRDACNAALAIRSAENIRIRQPLSTLTLYGKNMVDLVDFADILKDELNVKEVVFSEELDSVATLKLQVNLPVAGKRLGSQLGKIMPDVKQGKWSKDAEGNIVVGGETLEPHEYTLLLEARENKGTQALSTNDTLVVLDLTLTEALKSEGLARDLVRLVQQARKEADLHVSDRINLAVEVPDTLKAAIEKNKAYISEQTLATDIMFSAANIQPHVSEQTLDGKTVIIGLGVAA